MGEKILIDENKRYQFDFSSLEYVWEMHNLSNPIRLSDVDFITETEQEVLFIEYKNANIDGAVNPDGLLSKIRQESFYTKIARKFYDSLLLFWACKGNERELPILYVLIIEHPIIDKRIRLALRQKIQKQLPFKLKNERIAREIISGFHVYNLEEWTENYPQIPVTPVTK